MSKRGRWLLAGLAASAVCISPVVFFQLFVMPTGSMENTLLIGDHIAVPRFGSGQPARGDIVVFAYPVEPTQTFVKRVIGVPGDRLHIVNKQVYLNGAALSEPYKTRKTGYIDSYRDNFPSEPNVTVDSRAVDMLRNHVVTGEVVVPPKSYFVMGDNRDSSLDSRYWGFVPEDSIRGKPLFIYLSVDESGIRSERTFRVVR